MPYIIGLFIGMFAEALKSLVPRVLLALGLSYVTYQGFDVVLGHIRDIAQNASGMPPYVIGFLGLVKLGTATNIVLSAVSAKYAIMGLTSTFSRLQVK